MTSTIRHPDLTALCDSCGAIIRWAVTAATGSRIPLDAEPVPPWQRGALVLIGEIAFGRIAGVTRIARMFDCSEADAAIRAAEEYEWHVAHFATCPHAHEHRRQR